MPQERHRARDVSKDDAQFIILVRDIPRQCRWQELKDMTRHLGGEQSLKAEVFELRDGSQLGHCTIKGRSAANQVYDGFCKNGWNGLSVIVSLAILEKPGVLKTLEGPKKTSGIDQTRSASLQHSCAQEASATNHHGSSVNPLYVASSRQPGPLTYNSQYQSGSNITPTATGSGGHPIYKSGLNPYPYTYQATQTYGTSTVHADYASSVNQYATSYASTTPSNPSAIKPRSTNDGSTIFLSGLPYYQSEIELRRLLRRYGPLVYLEIHPDSRKPGKGKGTARARFQSPHEAIDAIRGLDGLTLGTRKISVKQAKDDATLSATGSSGNSESRKTNSSLPQKKKKQSKSRDPVSSVQTDRNNHGSTGPLVVNGARDSVGRRTSREETSESDECSEESSDEISEHSSSSDDEDEDEDESGITITARQVRHLRM